MSYATAALAGVNICRPNPQFLRKRIMRCPIDQCMTEMVVQYDAWYDPVVMCCRCGDSWSGGELRMRPFARGWRKRAAEQHRRAWNIATYGPAPTLAELMPDLPPEAVSHQ